MTQKRILRAASPTRTTVRERDKMLREAFRLYTVDADDIEVEKLLVRLADETPDGVTFRLFDMVNVLVNELSGETGTSRDELLARLQRS
jgi:hypothetical protein